MDIKFIELVKKYADKLPELVPREEFSELRFGCLDGCAYCCKEYLLIVPETDLQAKLNKGLVSTSISWLKAMKKEKGACVYLHESKCSIQSTKPLACKGYPFFVDPYTEKVYLDAKCKGIGQGEIITLAQENEMINYRKIYWGLIGLSEEEKKIISQSYFKKKF